MSEYSRGDNLRFYTYSCDKLYRWSMWRMHLNDELETAIACRGARNTRTKSKKLAPETPTVGSITSAYVNHPYAGAHGRVMRKSFGPANRKEDCILPDNLYLIYGLPRVSLVHKMPPAVKEMYASVEDLTISRDTESSSENISDSNEDKLSDIFGFISSYSKAVDSDLTYRKLGQKNRNGVRENANYTNGESRQTNSNGSQRYIKQNGPSNSKHSTVKSSGASKQATKRSRSEIEFPLVSKSRLFWERLANKRTEIIHMDKNDGVHGLQNCNTNDNVPVPPPLPPLPTTSSAEPGVAKLNSNSSQTDGVPAPPPLPSTWTVSPNAVPENNNDRFIPAPPPPPPPPVPMIGNQKKDKVVSRDIIEKQNNLLEQTSKSRGKDLWRTLAQRKTEILQLGELDGKVAKPKKPESKTSQFWGIIFSKKGDMLQQKKKNAVDDKKKTNAKAKQSAPAPFVDNFQRELAERLRSRRTNVATE